MNKKGILALITSGTLVLASPALLDFLGKWEGRGQYVVYADKLAGGLPTVCKGITKWTSPYPVIVGERWSPEKCAEVERRVTIETQTKLAACVKNKKITQNTFDALTSHAHNFGVGTTCASRAVRLINAGNIAAGCNALAWGDNGRKVWAYADGKYVQGLHNRRLAEVKLCLKPD